MRNGGEALSDFFLDTAAGMAEQSVEFFFKSIFFIGLADEIKDGQAFFMWRQPQAAS